MNKTSILFGIFLLSFITSTSPGNQSPPATQPAEPPRRLYVLVEGQIFDGVGMGIQGATIAAHRVKQDGSLELLNTATTNNSGDFKILHTNPNPGKIHVEVSKWGYANHEEDVKPSPEGLPPYMAVELQGGIIAFGRVIKADTDEPVPDAAVSIETAYTYLETTSDKNGHFQIKGLLPGSGVVGVIKEGFGRVRHPVEKLEEFSEIVIRLQRGRKVTITLKGDEDNPLSGAWYQALTPEPNDFREGQIDENGQIILDGIHAAATNLRFQVEHPNYLMLTSNIELPPDTWEISETVQLFQAGRLSGKVLSPDGKPVNGAKVIVGEGTDDSRPAGWADFSGDFEVTGITPGIHPVTVHLSGYSPVMREIEFPPGQRKSDEWFTLEEEATVTGTVVGPQGKPVAGAMIVCTGWQEHFTLRIGAISDKDGSFTIRSAPPDTFSIRASTRDGSATSSMEVKGGDTNVTITLDASSPNRNRLNDNIPAPPFEVTTLKGETLSLEKLKGKWILLDFWATWCTPCRLELPYVQDAQKEFGNREDFIIISISLDDDEKQLRQFIVEESITWAQVFGEKGGVNKITEAYRISGIPHTVLIDPDGNIVSQGMRGTWLAGIIRDHLEKEATSTQPAPTTQEAEPGNTEKENLPPRKKSSGRKV